MIDLRDETRLRVEERVGRENVRVGGAFDRCFRFSVVSVARLTIPITYRQLPTLDERGKGRTNEKYKGNS